MNTTTYSNQWVNVTGPFLSSGGYNPIPPPPWYVTHWPELVVLALTAVTVLASLTIPEVRYLAFKFLKRERA
ncbi:hypothetical protein [Metallosphaera hakonensis]|nr:hypothetical protein [Metallosphaera hakonensis]AWR99366.2 hypothetical protein DFR87_06215 [Metallosphaera hakonensis JCM 8857 = DSM 7519]